MREKHISRTTLIFFGLLSVLGFIGIVLAATFSGITMTEEKTTTDTVAALLASQQEIKDLIEDQKNTLLEAMGRIRPTPAPTSSTIDCDVAIIGAGPGGLTMAYRLALTYGSRLCVFDDRNHVGGKVFSVRQSTSNDTFPVWTPTHAEHLRSGDAILRCMAQELGVVTVARGSPGVFVDQRISGFNVSGFLCYGNVTPTGTATCLEGDPAEGFLAPNGYRTPGTSIYGNLPNPCGVKDWTECSYFYGYLDRLLSTPNRNTIQVGETVRNYINRILGSNALQYFFNIDYFKFQYNMDARAVMEYWIFDYAFPYGDYHEIHGAPQVALWNRVANLITSNGSRIMLNTRIASINRAINPTNGYTYALTTSTNTNIRAKRVVLAFPLQQLASMNGDVVTQLTATPFVAFNKATHACAWNAFFPNKWWQQYTSTCNNGWCAWAQGFNLTEYARQKFQQWNYIDDDDLGFIQYVPTPERDQGNLLRFYYEDERCEALDAIYASSGLSGVRNNLMTRLRARLASAVVGPIPDPTQSYYNSELYAYAGIAQGAPFTLSEQTQWAAAPLANEKLCFATESANFFHNGWMEGAAISAHNCLRGSVFRDIFSNTALNNLERCRQTAGDLGRNRFLTIGNVNSGNDACLLLRNEYHMKDLANYSYCGGPKIYQYPPLSSFEIPPGPFQPNQTTWSNIVASPVYEPATPRRQHYRHL